MTTYFITKLEKHEIEKLEAHEGHNLRIVTTNNSDYHFSELYCWDCKDIIANFFADTEKNDDEEN